MSGDPSLAPTPAVEPAVFIASLTDYVNGILHGKWLLADVPLAELEASVQAVLASSPWTARTGEPAEEWIILDHEGFRAACPDAHEQLAQLGQLARTEAAAPW